MKVLVTGTEGYIGVRLAPWLLREGHEVLGIDTGYYRDGTLYIDPRSMPVTPRTLCKDVRNVTCSDLEGMDVVVHLAELSNDPLGQNCPAATYAINHEGSIRIAQLARQAGVRRFVYTSSCSVYGVGEDDYVDETSPVNPQTVYAECKVLVERDLLQLADGRFTVVILRNATAYGPSPRMRFDIVVNDLCAMAWTTRLIEMKSDGSPWRPLVHVEDICRAASRCLIAPSQDVNGEILNVGSTSENYRVRDIAEIVGSVFPDCEVVHGPTTADNRSYRVKFDKIGRVLPEFHTHFRVRDGAAQLRQLFQRLGLTPDVHAFRAFHRLRQIQHLQQSGQLSESLYWTALS